MRRFRVTVTTAADGSATAYTPRFSGEVHSITYEKTDFANGVDFNITVDATGETIWAENDVNATATRAPRQPTHSTAGVASLYAAAGTAVQARVAVGNDKVKIVIASGGNVKTGTFHILVD